MTKYASVANDSANPTNNNRKGQKRLTDEEAAAAGVDFSDGPQMSKSPFYRTGVSRSPLEMHYKNADGKPQPHGYDLKKPKKSKKEASTSGVPKSYGLIIDKEDWDEFAKRTVKNKTSGLPMQSDSPLYKSTSDRIANRLARKTARIEKRQERKAGKARVARTKGNNALSNNNLSTEQKQRKALTQRKIYDKKMSKAGNDVFSRGTNQSTSWYDKGGAERK